MVHMNTMPSYLLLWQGPSLLNLIIDKVVRSTSSLGVYNVFYLSDLIMCGRTCHCRIPAGFNNNYYNISSFYVLRYRIRQACELGY